VNVDFNDVKAIMLNAGEALMGMGESSGESRALRATELAMSSPLLEDVSIAGARGVLVNITGSRNLTMHEINDAMTLIYNSVSSEANVYFGQVIDETMGDRIKITIIATNFDRQKDVKNTSSHSSHPDNRDDKKIIPEQQDLFDDRKDKMNLELNLEEPAFLRKNKK
jgi:cell division protein FtsZ